MQALHNFTDLLCIILNHGRCRNFRRGASQEKALYKYKKGLPHREKVVEKFPHGEKGSLRRKA